MSSSQPLIFQFSLVTVAIKRKWWCRISFLSSLLSCCGEQFSHPGSLGQRKESCLSESLSKSIAKIVPGFTLKINFTCQNIASPFWNRFCNKKAIARHWKFLKVKVTSCGLAYGLTLVLQWTGFIGLIICIGTMVWDMLAAVDAQELLWGKAQRILSPIYMTFWVQAGYLGCMVFSNFSNKSSKNHLVNSSAGVLCYVRLLSSVNLKLSVVFTLWLSPWCFKWLV